MPDEPSNLASLPGPTIKRDPYSHLYDVAVIGGGMCGLAAAIAAATESGKDVLIVERRAALGWELTSALHAELERSDQPIAHRIYRSINAMGGLKGNRTDQPTVEIALDALVDEMGVDLLLFSQPTRIAVSSDTITSVSVGSKGGEKLIRAKVYIDATEEAVLWSQTDVSWSGSIKPRPARQSVFFNFAGEGLGLPLSMEDKGNVKELTLYPSVRSGEVCAEFTVLSCNISDARVATKDAIAYIRDNVSELRDAAVTHTGFEPYPLDAQRVLEAGLPAGEFAHSTLGNLFGAGIWTLADDAERKRLNTPIGRAEIGEKSGEIAAACRVERMEQQKVGQLLAPTTKEYDVVVAGGGTAGPLAAIAAGRLGAQTLLLEAGTFLGGMVTGSTMYYGGHGVPGGLQDEVHKRTRETQEKLYIGKHPARPVHPEAGKLVLEEMCLEAGVEILYGTMAVGVEMDGNRVRAVNAATPRGVMIAKAHTVIDSTGDADVADFAGVKMLTGRDVDGVIHCYSQCAQMVRPGNVIGGCNFDSGFVDPWDIVDLTRARREGIRQLHERFARNLTAETAMMYICPLVGFRQGKLIEGDYQQSMLEMIVPTQYNDCIGYASAKYDCHSQDFENQNDLPVLWVWMLGNRERGTGGEIPYRCMLPKGVEGLLVACRSASTEYEGNYQFRVIRNMYRIGEAAGYAAALCKKHVTTPRALDVKLVQKELLKTGALGEEVNPGPVVEERPLDELREMLASDDPKDAVWLLAQGGEPEKEFLRDFVKRGPEKSRFWAATALAWHRDPEALPELMKAVSDRMTQRTDYTPTSRNMRPLWQSCIVMLGRIGDPEALPVLLEVLEDQTVDMDTIIAVVRALGRIGDDWVVPILHKLLERDDLPHERKLQQTSPIGRFPVKEDALWQLELATAEVLAGFGHPQPDIVQRYLKNPRNHVRRYARIVGERSNMEVPPDQMLSEYLSSV